MSAPCPPNLSPPSSLTHTFFSTCVPVYLSASLSALSLSSLSVSVFVSVSVYLSVSVSLSVSLPVCLSLSVSLPPSSSPLPSDEGLAAHF